MTVLSWFQKSISGSRTTTTTHLYRGNGSPPSFRAIAESQSERWPVKPPEAHLGVHSRGLFRGLVSLNNRATCKRKSASAFECGRFGRAARGAPPWRLRARAPDPWRIGARRLGMGGGRAKQKKKKR